MGCFIYLHPYISVDSWCNETLFLKFLVIVIDNPLNYFINQIFLTLHLLLFTLHDIIIEPPNTQVLDGHQMNLLIQFALVNYSNHEQLTLGLVYNNKRIKLDLLATHNAHICI